MTELELEHLSKVYPGGNRALSDVAYVFTPGVYGLLGPNGAGKSTLMNLLTLNLKPDSGSIFFRGRDVSELGDVYKKHIGYMPQNQGIYPDFTLSRFMYYMAALKGVDKKSAAGSVKELLRRVNLEDKVKWRLGEFSGGMRQRALLAQALLGDPDVVILDEPTAGLDPQERIRMRTLASDIARDRIVIIATHVVQDIEFIASDVIIMKDGHIICHGNPAELCRSIDGKVFELETSDTGPYIPERGCKICETSVSGKAIRVRMLCLRSTVPENAHAVDPCLEDVYLYYVEAGEDI